MIIVCVALIILLGKGTHKAYGHIKRKHQDRKRRRQDRVLDDQGCPSLSLPQSSQQVRGGRRGYRKLQINRRRRRGDENPHHHERDPEHSNTNLGISSEARASTQAHASHSDRHTYHQRARDLGVAISLRQARRINLEESNEEEITEELPRYDRDAPRPPSYQNCTSTSPDSLFRGESQIWVQSGAGRTQ